MIVFTITKFKGILDKMAASSTYYVKNKDLMWQLSASKICGCMIEDLASSFIKIVYGYASTPSWYSYPKQVKDELISNALCRLTEYWGKFNLDLYDNPFSYFTKIIEHSFIKTLNAEKANISFITFLMSMQNSNNLSEYSKYMDSGKVNCSRYINDEHYAEDDQPEQEIPNYEEETA